MSKASTKPLTDTWHSNKSDVNKSKNLYAKASCGFTGVAGNSFKYSNVAISE